MTIEVFSSGDTSSINSQDTYRDDAPTSLPLTTEQQQVLDWVEAGKISPEAAAEALDELAKLA